MHSSKVILPKVSIVMPSYNQGKYIEDAITSVLGQGYGNKELIVIDGGSNDNTPAILEKYRSLLSHCVSESDSGQSQAINKGFRLAKGEIFAWLNSDDMYLPGALDKVVGAIADPARPSLVYGAGFNFTQGKPRGKVFWPKQYDSNKLKYRDYLNQPATFWTRSLWHAAGELNESYHFVMDWDWYIRASRICSFTRIEEMVCAYRFHDQHKTSSGSDTRVQEILSLVEANAEEEWISIYRDVRKNLHKLKHINELLAGTPLYRIRQLFCPALYFRHGTSNVECALRQYCG